MPDSDDSTDISPVSAAWLTLDIVEDGGDWQALAPVDRAIAAAAHALAKHPRFALQQASEACIALSDDASVRRLNVAYRAKDKPTNVLSFPAPRQPGNALPRALGDVVLAHETVFREAAELRIPPVHHLQHLVIHGLLHLLGWDHEKDDDAEAMEALEVEILASLGIASPYADESSRAVTIEA